MTHTLINKLRLIVFTCSFIIIIIIIIPLPRWDSIGCQAVPSTAHTSWSMVFLENVP